MFTKLLRPLVKRWRPRGIRAIVYIDVGIITSIPHSPRLLSIGIWCWMTIVKQVTFLLWSSAPSQVGKWLGFISDLVEVKFQVPEEKLTKL